MRRLYGSMIAPALSGPVHVCARCRGAARDGYQLCRPCQIHEGAGVATASRIAFLTYALQDGQFYTFLRAYKSELVSPARSKAQVVVSNLLFSALARHLDCVERLSGQSFNAWAVVPSIRANATSSYDHALRKLADPMLRSLQPRIQEVEMQGQSTQVSRRADPDLYHVRSCEGHVLLLEDTWVSGSHAEAAATALRREGASEVSVLCIARLISPGYRDGQRLIARVAEVSGAYDPLICPWTWNGECP